jgi:hypothetical protein
LQLSVPTKRIGRACSASAVIGTLLIPGQLTLACGKVAAGAPELDSSTARAGSAVNNTAVAKSVCFAKLNLYMAFFLPQENPAIKTLQFDKWSFA